MKCDGARVKPGTTETIWSCPGEAAWGITYVLDCPCSEAMRIFWLVRRCDPCAGKLHRALKEGKMTCRNCLAPNRKGKVEGTERLM